MDWHHPQWLAVAILTLLLCTADAFLTLVLLERGATEANPFMQPLVGGSPLVFAHGEDGPDLGRHRRADPARPRESLGRIPVSVLLYGVLFAYAALVGYEFWLLTTLFQGP